MDTKITNETRPNRWLRFSLRSVLLASTIVGLILGSFGSQFHNSRRQAKAVDSLTSTGAQIRYDDWQIIDNQVSPRQARVPRGPKWMRRVLGPHFFDRVVKVTFRHTPSEDFSKVAHKLKDLRHLRSIRMWSMKDLSYEQFAFIGDLQNLETLECGFMEIDERHARKIAQSRGLRSIGFNNVKLSSAALREFGGLPHLETFEHSSPADRSYGTDGLDDQAIEAFTEFPQLRDLSLYGTLVTNEGIKTLSELRNLEKLTIGSRLVTGDAMEYISNMKQLETLGTWGWKLKDNDLTALPSMRALKHLDLLCTFDDPIAGLTDDAVTTIVEMPQLTSLRIRGLGITDRSLPLLHSMTNLTILNMDNTSVDRLGDAANQLRAALLDCVIRLPMTGQQEAAMKEKMKQQFNDWKYGQRSLQK